MIKPIKPKVAKKKDLIREPNITFPNELVWRVEWNREFKAMKSDIGLILEKLV